MREPRRSATLAPADTGSLLPLPWLSLPPCVPPCVPLCVPLPAVVQRFDKCRIRCSNAAASPNSTTAPPGTTAKISS